MINRKLLFSIGTLIVLGVIAILVWITLGTHTTNPPVVVVGGSIHTHYPHGWAKDAPNVQYHGRTTTNTAIYTKHIYDQSGVLVSQPISVTGGFVIKFYDSDPTGTNPRSDAGLALCSSAQCDPTAADPNIVYLRVLRSGDQLEEHSSSELHFHSLGLNGQCDTPGNSTESRCDRINHLGIENGNTTEAVYTCGGHDTPAGHCKIGIGDTPP